jgi:5'-nucleotidase, C-terminal domain
MSMSAHRTEVALTVNGFFTEVLTRGPLVRDDAFRIVGDGIDPSGIGLGFPLYRIELTGQNLLTALATTIAIGGDLFVQVSGMRHVFDSRTGQLVAAYVHGQPIDPARAYSATVNLGVVAGLGQLPGLGAPPARREDSPARGSASCRRHARQVTDRGERRPPAVETSAGPRPPSGYADSWRTTSWRPSERNAGPGLQ